MKPLKPLTPMAPLEPITHAVDWPEDEEASRGLEISNAGLQHLIKWEGAERQPYRDVAGHLTIGVGHLITDEEKLHGYIEAGGREIFWKDGISDQDVVDILEKDVQWAMDCVHDKVKVPLGQFQFDALVSFVFNVGCYAFGRSTLLRLLNGGQYEAVPGQLRRWVKAGGRRIPGLVNRRQGEIELWNT